jgi:hypothetical protein
LVDDGDTVKIKISEEQIKSLSVEYIALIWGLSNNGYGRGRELSSEERKKMELEIKEVQSSLPEIKFANSSQSNIAKYCKKVLDLLEQREVNFS